MVSKARLFLLFSLSFSLTSCLLFIALTTFLPDHSAAQDKTPAAKRAAAEIGIPALVKDIITAPVATNSDPANFVVAGAKLYFTAHDDTRGVELWLTGGSPGGTHIVKDMIPGAASSNPGPLVDVSGTLFLKNSADNALWKSDGTAANTQRLYKFVPGGGIGAEMATVNGRVFFPAIEHSGEDAQLWQSDGTLSGTTMVSRTLAGQGAHFGHQPNELTPGNNKLFYLGISDEGDEALFTTDGTALGSRQLEVENAFGLHFAGDTLYFSARDAEHGNELWKSTGTPTGTVMVSDIFSGPNDSDIDNIVNISNTIYFSAQKSFTRQALWKSDGTSDTTTEVYWTPGLTPAQLTPVGEKLFFVDLSNGDLLVSDGTPDGTSILHHFSNAFNQSPDHLVALDGTLYFIINDGPDAGLWRSDGTPTGTTHVKQHTPSPKHESAGQPIAFAGKLYYKAWDAVHGWELWQSDGTEEGTQLYANIAADVGSTFTSCPAWTTTTNLLFFQVGCNQSEALWRSDGTVTGTIDLITFSVASSVTEHFVLTTFQDAAFLGYQGLWRSNGSPGDTQKLAAIDPLWFETFHNQLFMAAAEPTTGIELWRSDGKIKGTTLVLEIQQGVTGSLTSEHAVAGNLLYFVADDGQHGAELWKSDGTKAGTTLVKDIEVGPDSAQIHHLFGVGSRLYFLNTTSDEGQELWTSDGTDGGTHLVRDINPGEPDGVTSDPHFVALNSVLYFVADDGLHGAELWRSDGAQAGTQLVRDIYPGLYSGQPQDIIVFAGKLYFGADDGVHGIELWQSDGTQEGTKLAADIVPGPDSSNPTGMRVVDNGLLFAANGNDNGYELWVSDGTAAGTAQLADIAPGENASNPNDFHVAGNNLFFVANDGARGNELWFAPVIVQQKGGTIYFPLLRS